MDKVEALRDAVRDRFGAEPGWPRAELLDEAKRLTTGDRNIQYGSPTQDFERTAAILNAMGYAKASPRDGFVQIEPHDVALMVAAVKMSRLAWSPEKRDSWVDLAGYAACGHEAYVNNQKEN